MGSRRRDTTEQAAGHLRRRLEVAFLRPHHREGALVPGVEMHSPLRDGSAASLLPLAPGPVQLFVCGISDADLDGHQPTAPRVKPMGLQVALRMRDPPLVVVLGDEALQVLSPSVIARLLKRPGCVSLAYSRTCPAHVIADWSRRCPIEFPPEGRLSRRIALACRLGGADLGAVLADEKSSTDPCSRREKMRKALLALRELKELRVKTWASTLGMTRHVLKRLCISTVGFPPEDFVWAVIDTRVRRGVLHGRSDEEIAKSVGIPTAYDLRRAYARRGLPFPGA